MKDQVKKDEKHTLMSRAVVILVVMNMALMWSCWYTTSALKKVSASSPTCPVVIEDKDNDQSK